MTQKPYFNAFLALTYITCVAVVMNFVGRHVEGPDQSFIGPVSALSMFTLSAAVMGYLFAAVPLQLYLDGKKKEGVKFFLQTVGSFAILTVVVFLILLSKIFA